MFLLCLGVAMPLLAIGSFSLFKEYRTLKLEAERATTLQAATGVRTLSNWMTGQLDAIDSVANLLEKQDLKNGNIDINKTLATATVSQPSWSKLVLFSSDGQTEIASASNNRNRPATVAAGSSNDVQGLRDLLLKTRQTKKAAIATSTILQNGKPFILAAAPLTRNNQVKGQLVAYIDPSAVLDLYAGLTGSSDKSAAVIAIIDAHKRVVARTIDNDQWVGKDFSQARSVRAAQGKQKGTYEAVGIADATPRAYAFDHEPITNWLVVIGLPTKLIYGTAHDWLILMICLAACAVSVSIMLAYSSTTYFTRAINSLVREALSLGRGDFSKRVRVNSADELGLLARAFNEMATLLEVDRDHKNMVRRISESIRQSLDLNEILNTTVKELGENLQASRCCLALIETHETASLADDELSFDYMWCNQENGVSPLKQRKILIGVNTAMRKIINQDSIIWLDLLGTCGTSDDENPQSKSSAGADLFEGHEDSDWRSIKSMIACPITTGKGTIGLILIHQCDHLRTWSQSELELVNAVASQVALAIEHGQLYNQARTMAEQEQLINHIVKAVRTSLDLDTILDTVTRELTLAMSADRVQIAQPRAEGPLVVTHEYHREGLESTKGLSLYGSAIDFHPNAKSQQLQSDTGNFVLGIDLSAIRRTYGAGQGEANQDAEGASMTFCDGADALQCEIDRQGLISVVSQVDGDARCQVFSEYLEQVGGKSLIAAPLINGNQLVGVLIVHQCSETRLWRDTEANLVGAVADQLSVAIAHAQLFAQVRHQAITDGLTGLYNHVYFKNRLSEELRMAERKGTSVSLIMIDLDKLKMINDTYGHPVGDAAIRQIAAILKTLLRSGDTAARYGGEEFGIILPETSLLEAALIADRLCSQIRNSQVPVLGKITASLGTASYPKQARSSSELIERADKALYVAKNSGRDQVRVYEEEMNAPSTPTFTNVTRDMEKPKSAQVSE